MMDRILVALIFVASVSLVVYSIDVAAPRDNSAISAPLRVDGAGADTQGTAPPPYNDPNKTITNALGGMGRTEGYTVGVSKTAAHDVLNDAGSSSAEMPPGLIPELTSSAVTANERRVVLTLAQINSSGGGNVEAVCARVGPTTDGDGVTPAMLCPNLAAWPIATGGCYLTAVGQSCSITLRPITDPQPGSSYAERHIPIWVLGSSDLNTASTSLHVGLAW